MALDSYDMDTASESGASSAVSFSSFSCSHASSNTSVSMRSASPVPSVLSVTSSLRADAYRAEYGRAVNNKSEIYRLPADDVELDRLGAPFVLLHCGPSLMHGQRLAA
jgi:hypothetical protein